MKNKINIMEFKTLHNDVIIINEEKQEVSDRNFEVIIRY